MQSTLPKNRAAKSRSSLDRKAWIHAANDALAEEGLAGLRVEILAKRCGVTKGSFYWHFRDRQELLDEVLAQWKEGRIRDVSKQAKSEIGQERASIIRAIELYSASRNRRGIQIELAIRDWARRDPKAAAIVAEVDAWRLKRTQNMFTDAGFSEAEAKIRSLLFYAYAFGSSLMIYEQFDEDIGALRTRIAEFIAENQSQPGGNGPSQTMPPQHSLQSVE
ncbi:MAG: TetR/AcrR family transcriptional regulator [Betaproteobacteria bacterium]|nr:TetR/AcrR family transcriptional regulator [Betaproteobacteria bacterium]